MVAPSYPAPSVLDIGTRTRRRRALAALSGALLGCASIGCAAAPDAREAIEPQVVEASASPGWTLPTPAEDPLHRTFAVELAPSDDGSLLSGIIGDGLDFTEALPSWNVPSGEPFLVDIRARRSEEAGPWSPWLRIGDWGTSSRDADTPVKFSAGKVAVDVFQLTAPHDAVQLRFQRPDGTLDPAEVRASVVLSDMTQLEATLKGTSAAPWPGTSLLRVAPRSQRAVGDDIGGRICSPTSVSMVSAYHGADIPTREMANSLLDPHYDIYGNWNRAVQGPATLGVPGRLVRVSSWSSVAAYLDAGLPVVASIRAKEGELRGAPYKKTAGHLLVVTGLGPAGAVHVNDPAARLPLDVPRVYQRADVERVWFANGGVGYVFGPRIDGEEAPTL